MTKLSSLLCIIFFLTFPTQAKVKESLRFASGEFPPYLSNDLKYNGLYAKILNDIFSDTDFKIELDFFPWNRSLFLLKTGEYEVSPMWIQNKKRDEDFYFSVPITFNEKVLFHLKASGFHWDSYEDLKKYKIALTKNYTYGNEIDKLAEERSANLIIVPEDRVKFKMLIEGRIQAFPMDLEAGYYLAKKYLSKKEFKQITHHKKPVLMEGMKLMFSKKMDEQKRKKAIKLVEQKMISLKKNGTIDKYFWKLRNGSFFQ
ncbi:MAG: transporter substrate-binding domain-containing protein [Bdellovibrionota bacterium]|nr:transporter substrate-binding domain-containing protein [Bdellovibrionota bacterium]